MHIACYNGQGRSGGSQVALSGEGLLLIEGGAAFAQDGRVCSQRRFNARLRLCTRRQIRRRRLLHLPPRVPVSVNPLCRQKLWPASLSSFLPHPGKGLEDVV